MEYKLPCMTYIRRMGAAAAAFRFRNRCIIMEYKLPCMTNLHRIGAAAENNNIHRLPSEACCQPELPGLFVGLWGNLGFWQVAGKGGTGGTFLCRCLRCLSYLVGAIGASFPLAVHPVPPFLGRCLRCPRARL